MGEKFKDNLSEILAKAGFDSKVALLSLNSLNITEIEKHVNTNRSDFCDFLKKTKYEKLDHNS